MFFLMNQATFLRSLTRDSYFFRVPFHFGKLASLLCLENKLRLNWRISQFCMTVDGNLFFPNRPLSFHRCAVFCTHGVHLSDTKFDSRSFFLSFIYHGDAFRCVDSPAEGLRWELSLAFKDTSDYLLQTSFVSWYATSCRSLMWRLPCKRCFGTCKLQLQHVTRIHFVP